MSQTLWLVIAPTPPVCVLGQRPRHFITSTPAAIRA